MLAYIAGLGLAWAYARNLSQSGQLYGAARIGAEFFREPDPALEALAGAGRPWAWSLLAAIIALGAVLIGRALTNPARAFG